jgi:hypothetical protein
MEDLRMATTELTDRDRAMLRFESQWPRHTASKEEAIRDTFHVSAPRYYQLLNALAATQAALAHDPLMVNRLRAATAARAKARASRTLLPSSRTSRGGALLTQQ